MLTDSLRPPATSRALLATGLVASKIVVVALLLIMSLGYLFFMASHSTLTHTYFVVSAAAMVLALVVGPGAIRTKAFRLTFFTLAMAATGLGGWKIVEHLAFFEGPEYGAAVLTGCALLAIWTSGLCSHQLARAQESDDASQETPSK